MKKLWNKIKAHFSGWPEGAEEGIKGKEEIIKEQVKESKARKTKKPKGLNSKKKKSKGKKQGNLT